MRVKPQLKSNHKDINARQHHRQTIRQPLYNIIRIIHHRSDKHSRESLFLIPQPNKDIQDNRNPCPLIVSNKESFRSDSRQIRRNSTQTAEEAGSKTQLNALNPNVVFLLSFQYHFEENARETTRERADHDADEAKNRILLGCVHFRSGGFAAQLNQTNTRNDNDESNPLTERQLFVEEENREQSCGENFHLICHGVNCRIKMGDCYK